jgi:hypothetical protein
MEVVGNNVGFQKDLQHVIQTHAKNAHFFVGSYHLCYYPDRDNFDGALLHITAWIQKLFNSWDNEICIIKAVKEVQYNAKVLEFIQRTHNHKTTVIVSVSTLDCVDL